MQQLVRVQKCNDDGTVLVTPVQMELCPGKCQSCTGCKIQKPQLQKVKNSIDAACGQVVVLTTNRWLELLVRLSYLLPVLLLLPGICLRSSMGGVAGFFIGLAFALWVTTKESAAYTITGFAKKPIEKGDHDLD